ncbi:glycoside hydrolase family 3 N-terminal domain-containing protein [Enterococcus sp. OL5]|uniref:glycoside hydrolase family 3 N-terminal domain-containing protein n=1 Tax=Enterococcus sp. OL5 TaxID=2590214 RepID=UPI001678B314|nr:glycoside hydrolase family 3 N-terminal domain-containing protein [Enterococcus sp. OL5]
MKELKYLNKNLSSSERAKDLIERMTIDEKISQLQCYNPKDKNGPNLEHDFPNGVGAVAFLAAAWDDSKETVAGKLRSYQEIVMKKSRLGIPALFHIEGLTGVLMPEATSFPTGIGRGAAWDMALEKRAGKVIGQEMSAVGIKHALAPVLDVSRDARFGRYGECYSEDPTLVSALGAAYVEGIQNSGTDESYNVMATSKHFVGYQAGQGGIHAAATNLPERELQEIFGKPFQAAIAKSNLRSVMNHYGAVDGEPMAGSRRLLQELLRKEMKFDGLLVSDYASLEELHSRMGVCENKTDAAKLSLEVGFDMEFPTPNVYTEELKVQIQKGKINSLLLDQAVSRVLTEKFELGLFEEPFPKSEEVINQTFNDIESKKVSLTYARESMTLLKNNGILPVNPSGKKIAVIGHLATSVRSLFGGYSYMSVLELAMGGRNTMAGIETVQEKAWKYQEKESYPGSIVDVEFPHLEKTANKCYDHCNNILEELKKQCSDAEIRYSYGYPYVGSDETGHDAALDLAQESDVTIVTVGGKYGWGTSCSTGEGIDSSSINLPPCQERFLEKLGKAGIEFIVVHLDGRPISSDAADKYASAIIEAWNPGEFGSQAIVETIIGVNNPSGKLPVTVAYSSAQAPLYYNHGRGSSYHVGTQSPFTSYIDLPHTPRYYFGHGLSYTSFKYSDLSLSKIEVNGYEKLKIELAIENTGDCKGTEVVQLYINDPISTVIRPERELVGFGRISLAPQEKKKIIFEFHISQLAFLDREMRWKVESGLINVMLGSSCNDIRLKGKFTIKSDEFVTSETREFYSHANCI